MYLMLLEEKSKTSDAIWVNLFKIFNILRKYQTNMLADFQNTM